MCQKPYCLMTVVADELICIHICILEDIFIHILSPKSPFQCCCPIPSSLSPVPDSTQMVSPNGLSFFPHNGILILHLITLQATTTLR